MLRSVLLSSIAVVPLLTVPHTSFAQTVAGSAAPLQPTIQRSGYVRLEVLLKTNAADQVINFQSACPKQSLWDIEIKQLLSGSKNVTLGVSISAPQMTTPLKITPVAIDKKKSGFLGLEKSCDVLIDQIRYLSPAYYVRTFENQQFTVSPSYQTTTGVNPGLASTINTALSIALKLSGVPAASAAPYQQQVTTLLQQVSVNTKETYPKRLTIKPGPVPADTENEWRSVGLLTKKDGGTPVDVILIARLVPAATLIPDPQPGANGAIAWTPATVLSSPFSADPAPGAASTLGAYISSAEATNLANFRSATTKGAASNACDAILLKVQAMGLSDRDQALLMWAITHDILPTAVDPFDIDNLHCLTSAWQYAPSEVTSTRIAAPKPVVLPGAPPTVKQMQAATQIEDAFAIFFKTSVWSQRRKIGVGLFSYPAKYTDTGGLLFDASSSVENADQWLALHTTATPVANRVGCYTYIPASDAAGKSLMYAIADLMDGRSSPQAILIVTFANVSGSDDAKIDSIEVANTVSADQKAKILAAQGSECSSGYRPAIVFGS